MRELWVKILCDFNNFLGLKFSKQQITAPKTIAHEEIGTDSTLSSILRTKQTHVSEGSFPITIWISHISNPARSLNQRADLLSKKRIRRQ